MKRTAHVLSQYREILDNQLLHAARANVARIEQEIAGIQDDSAEAIGSSIVHAVGDIETHGKGNVSDPVFRGYRAYLHELAQSKTLRRELRNERAELLRAIRHMESIVSASERWLNEAKARPVGALTTQQVIARFWRGETNETIAIACEYRDESIIRKWLTGVDGRIRELMSFHQRITRFTPREIVPKSRRKYAETQQKFLIAL